MAAPLFIPALTGVPMLQGLPPTACVLEGYGFENYPADARSRSIGAREICTRARRKGFSAIIVIGEAGHGGVYRLNCLSGAGASSP